MKINNRKHFLFGPNLTTAVCILLFGCSSAFSQPTEPANRSQLTVSAATRLSDTFADVAKAVEPAVVSIDAKSKTAESAARNRATPSEADDIMEFFRRQLPRRPVYSVGSGFIIDTNGYILTNAHVIDNAAKIIVRLYNGDEFPATLVGTDIETDLAVLKIDAGRTLTALKLADSEKVRVGDWVLAIGSPFGLSKTVTAGIVSQVKRETPDGSAFQRFIQTDAAINRGNSGGPLVNLDGEAIGINSQIATTTGDYNGVGFALPSSDAATVAKQLITGGKVKRGFLGVGLDSVKTEFAKVYNLGETRGAIVTEVREAQSAAARAGIRSGDIIVEFEGKPITSAEDLIARASATLPDTNVNVTLLREVNNNMERKTVALKLGERPLRRIAAAETTPSKVSEPAKDLAKPFGLTLIELTPQAAADYQVEGQTGLFVKEINPESTIAEVKTSSGNDALGQGDIIQRINRIAVKDSKSFTDAVNRLKKGDAVVLHVISVDPRTKAGRLKIVQFTVQ
jgi:serine protease Do